MQNNDGNFLDSKTLLAIVLVGGVWFGWQAYLSKKYPTPVATTEQTQNSDSNQAAAAHAEAGVKIDTKLEESNPTTTPVAVNSEIAEVKEALEVGTMKFSVSSKGMAIKAVTLNNYKEKNGSPIVFTGVDTGLFALTVDGKPVDFTLEKVSENTIRGKASFSDLTIEREISFQPENYTFNNSVNVLGNIGQRKLEVVSQNEKRTYESGHFLFPSYEFQEFYVLHEAEKSERINITHSEDPINSTYKLAKVASIDSHYFTVGLVDASETIPDVKVTAKDKTLEMSLIYGTLPSSQSMKANFKSYIGPRDLRILEKSDAAFAGLVNFGFFAWIAKPLLKTMHWFYGLVGNWGIAIILLTLLVRMVVLPLHMMSFRSMKAMQKVQPLINALREKHKEDPTTLNREMMDLMRQHKVNPLGGCLPMLLQIPVFFALYQVFGQSIDLYQAPFALWITDLSLKDPFYVLPVLMSVVMFIQQKITPTTMDPTQAKIMAFMPIIFSVFMLSLPSALTLYMFVSTLFGIIQQYLFLRDKTVTSAIKAAKA